MGKGIPGKRKYLARQTLFGITVAILVIIFIAYIFLFGSEGEYFNNPGCEAAAGFVCSKITVSPSGTLFITFGQNTGAPIYNMSFTCVTGNETPAINSSYWIGLTTLNVSSNGTLNAGPFVYLEGLSCYSLTTNSFIDIKSHGFVGNIWLRYNRSDPGLAMSTLRVAHVYYIVQSG